MTLMLRHPQLIFGEGPQGFLLRLANENGQTLSSLKSLGIFYQVDLLSEMRCIPSRDGSQVLLNYAKHVDHHLEDSPHLWNQSYCRWCPSCLIDAASWRVGWELFFVDACVKHGCWLIDRCDSCGERITWAREELMRCNCGQHLTHARVQPAPDSVVGLAHDLEDRFIDAGEADSLPILHGLKFEQITRLIRFIGSYGQSNTARLPQKIKDLSAMDVSWQITSTSAEVLARWPECFNQMLFGMLDRSEDQNSQRFPARFGFFYASIFRRFAEPEFAFLRSAFENFVAEHWRGPLAKRNSRLSLAILDRAPWVPANHARTKLGVSRSRLQELVSCGQLVGEERISDKGRRYLMVKRDSLECLLPKVTDELDLMSASKLLGLTKARLRSVLPILFPNARKVEGDTNHWAISRTEIDTLLHRCVAPPAHGASVGQVSLDHVMRFWACSEAEFGGLLVALRDGHISPIARLPSNVGVSHLVFDEAVARAHIARQRQSAFEEWTIPEVADILSIKQEVAYFLVRNGMLASESKVIGRRMVAMVSRQAIEQFGQKYVFARDLAKLRLTSPRSLQIKLAELRIHPATAQMVPPCRQALYEWTAQLRQIFPDYRDSHIPAN